MSLKMVQGHDTVPVQAMVLHFHSLLRTDLKIDLKVVLEVVQVLKTMILNKVPPLWSWCSCLGLLPLRLWPGGRPEIQR